MTRFDLFEKLKAFIYFSEPYFETSPYNPFQVLLVPIYLETLRKMEVSKNNEIIPSSEPANIIEKTKKLLQLKLSSLKSGFYKKKRDSRIFYLHRPVLFLPVEPNHITQFSPIWGLMKKKNVPYLIITNRKRIFKTLRDVHPIIFLERQFTPHAPFAWKKVKDLQNEVVLTKKNEIGCKELLEAINNSIKHQSIFIHNLYHQLHQVISQYEPPAVVAGYDITPEGRLLTIIANKMDIPSYCIMHGSISGEPLHKMHLVDHFLLFGEASKRELIKIGVPSSQLIVTGAPYLDNGQFQKKKINNIIKKNLGFTDEKPYFLITNSGPGHSTSFVHFQETIDQIFKLSLKFPDIHWVIKMHKKDRLEYYEDTQRKYGNHRIAIVSDAAKGFPRSIFEWIRGAHALLTGTSTVAIEAMSMNVPVITMDFMSEYKNVDFIDRGATIHVTNGEELEGAVHTLLENPGNYKEIGKRAEEYARLFFKKSNVPASEKILNLLTSSGNI